MARTLLTAYDRLVPAGTAVHLDVEVERRWGPFLDPAAPGVEVRARGASAPTDAAGRARLDLGLLDEGLHRVEASAEGARAEALVRVVPRDATVFVTDIDHTIADVSSVGFIFKPLERVRMLEGALEAVHDIAREMVLVYLSARDHIYLPKTKRWLSLMGFPEAPAYLRRGTRFWDTRSRAHKTARLGELTEAFPEVRWGVGDLRGDALAYAARGIRPILIAPRAPAGLPEGTVHATSWAEIRRTVLGGDA